MPSLEVTIERSEVGARSHATGMRAALLAVANRHLFHRIGDHFKPGPKTAPGGAYGFQRRSQKYLDRIAQLKKKQPAMFAEAGNPLTFTGRTKRYIRNNSPVTATQYQARIRLKAPHVLKEQQWKELSVITDEENQEDNVLATEIYLKTLKELGARKSRKRIS